MKKNRYLIFCYMLFFFLDSQNILAREFWNNAENDSENSFKTNSSVKGTSVATQGGSSAELLRLRFESVYKSGSWIFDAAYDNHLVLASNSNSGLLYYAQPASAPYRVKQIAGSIYDKGNTSDYHELDRGFAAYQTTDMSLTGGRQAIGWGRGNLFSAVDIFSPFTPLDIDREWRRGVDAIRWDQKISDTSSVEVISAFGPTWSESAAGVRLRGYFGSLDGEVLLAKRGTDKMYALTSSAVLGDGEVHSELALFDTPGDILELEGFMGDRKLIPKGLIGASDNIEYGNGIKIGMEYHYSGFGASKPTAISALLADANFEKRWQRGDSQIIGTQALGMLGSYSINEKWVFSLEHLQSLIDNSGVVMPSLVCDFSDSVSFLSTVILGYGESPTNTGLVRSQFGGTPMTLVFQIRAYD